MRLPLLHIRTLMVAVAVVAVVFALVAQLQAGNPAVIAGLILAVVLSVAWVPAVVTFLPLVVARWIFGLACLALLASVIFAVYETVTGARWRVIALGSSMVSLWVAFTCGLGYFLSWARHDFRSRQARLPLKRPRER